MSIESELDNKVDRLINSDIKSGEEILALSKGQQQLMEINAAQRENLMSQVSDGKAIDASNQILAQASGILASGGLGGGAQQVQQMNPQTQAVLGKFGLKPKNVHRSTSSTSRSSQNITVNNKTENRTTTINNIAGGGPTQARGISFQPKEDNTAKFKAWINNVFASQKEASARRDKEYKKKEWSLSRTTRQLMRGLQDMTKTISSRLDPNRMSSSIGGQMKTLYLLIGLPLLIKNLGKFLNYIGATDKKPFKESKLVKDVKNLFMGDDGKSGMFGSLGSMIGGSIKSVFREFFKERAAALKTVQPLKLDMSAGPVGILEDLGEYLKQILGCLVSGKDAIITNTRRSMAKVGAKASMSDGSYENSPSWSSSAKDLGREMNGAKGAAYNQSTDRYKSGVDLGGISAFRTKNRGAQNYLTNFDFKKDGTLRDNASAAKKQSAAVGAMIGETFSGNSNKLHIAGITSGLGALDKSVKENKNVLIDKQFLENLKHLGINVEDLKKAGGIGAERFALVKRKKNDADYESIHGIKGWKETAAEAGIKTGVINAGVETTGGGKLAKVATNAIVDKEGRDLNTLLSFSPLLTGLGKGLDAAADKAAKRNYYMDVVPLSDVKYTDERVWPDKNDLLDGVSPEGGAYAFPVLTEEGMNFIKEKLSEIMGDKVSNSNYSFSELSDDQLRNLNTFFVEEKKKNVEVLTEAIDSKRDKEIARKDELLGKYESQLEKDNIRFEELKSVVTTPENMEKVKEERANILKRRGDLESSIEQVNRIKDRINSKADGEIHMKEIVLHDVNVGEAFETYDKFSTPTDPVVAETVPTPVNNTEGDEGKIIDEEKKSEETNKKESEKAKPSTPSPSPSLNKGQYFTLEQLSHSDTAIRMGVSNKPDEKSAQNLIKLRDNILNPLQDYLNSLGKGIKLRINSGYRGPKVNEAVGGVPTSNHMTGNAVDVTTGDRKLDKKLAKYLTDSGLVGYTYQKDTAAGNSFFHITRKPEDESYLDFSKIMSGDFSKTSSPVDSVIPPIESNEEYLASNTKEEITEVPDVEYKIDASLSGITGDTQRFLASMNNPKVEPIDVNSSIPTFENVFAETSFSKNNDSNTKIPYSPAIAATSYTPSTFMTNDLKKSSSKSVGILAKEGDMTYYLRSIEHSTRVSKDAAILGIKGTGIVAEAICEQTKIIQHPNNRKM